MFTLYSLLAATTIAGAFWIGVLAARRLRDWGERRVLEDAGAPVAALGPGTAIPADDGAARRVRALVAERLAAQIARGEVEGGERTERLDADALGFSGLRAGDVVAVAMDPPHPSTDACVRGVLTLKEGATSTWIVVGDEGTSTVWIVGSDDDGHCLVVRPVADHGLSGEPPRVIERGGITYNLQRRSQAVVAGFGRHDRPNGSRVAFYVYRGPSSRALWVERWGHEVLVAEGHERKRWELSFIPGT